MKALKLSLSILFAVNFLATSAQKRIKISGEPSITRDTIAHHYKFSVELLGINVPGDSNLKVKISANGVLSTLPGPDFSISSQEFMLHELGKGAKSFFLTIKGDKQSDRDRQLVLQASAYDSSAAVKDTALFTVNIKGLPKDSSIRDYQYLVYLGTSFDLVDRLNASKLFFASNIFLPPSPKKRSGIGMYLSLYGNRTMSATDSSGEETYFKYVKLSDSTAMKYKLTENLIRTRVSDNLGAYFSPLIRIRPIEWRKLKIKSSKPQGKTNVYYSPSAEFIWKRTTTSSQRRNPEIIDSSIDVHNGFIPAPPSTSSQTHFNAYYFNVAPIGIFIAHENDIISVRVYAAVGWSESYTPRRTPNSIINDEPYTKSGDFFFSGRAWITEATTGITLQGEIINAYNNPRPAYVVTLSKAISFKTFSTLFTPLTK